MHASMERLYDAARRLRNVEGQSEAARLLNESPQTLNNWESRGISAIGALKAQRLVGCDANWIIDGAGPSVANAAMEPQGVYRIESWPFSIARTQYDALPDLAKGQIDGYMLAMVQASDQQKKMANG